MSELTIVACPTCGLPAELSTRLNSGPDGEAHADLMIRCVDRHVATIPLSAPASELQVSVERVVVPAPVVALAPRRRRAAIARMVKAVRARSLRVVWFVFGAIAALLFMRAPVAALVLLPLMVPLAGVAAARRSWRAFGAANAAVLPADSPRRAAGTAGGEQAA